MVDAENKKTEDAKTQGTKREREDDAGDAGERETKKVDTKEGEAGESAA